MTPATPLPERLAEAIRSRTPIEPDEGGLGVPEAYELQDRLIELIGAAPVAAKLGLTSLAKQRQMSVGEPVYGWLLDGMQVEAGAPLACDRLIQPRAEPEVAFVTGADLGGPGVGAWQVLAATRAVAPALDVLDSRYAGYRFTLPAVIADNASAAGFALGDPVGLDGVDLRLVGCVFEKNGEVVATAAGAAVLDHPAAAVAWLVRALARRGRTLPAGSLVLAGGLTAAAGIGRGDVVRATFDRIGHVELRCA